MEVPLSGTGAFATFGESFPFEEPPVTRNRIIFTLVLVGLVAAVVGGFVLLPKQYRLGQRLNQTIIFWNDQEAFFFLNSSTVCQSSNFITDNLAKTRYGYLLVLLSGRSQFYEYGTTAYHLLPSGVLPSGELKNFGLPDGATGARIWTLDDGKLQLTTINTEYSYTSA